MSDNTDLIARLNDAANDDDDVPTVDYLRRLCRVAAAALAARDAHCGHLDNQLVAKALDWVVKVWDYDPPGETEFTDDELDALRRAATFEAPE